MLIVQKNDDAAFVRQIDAESRVTVWAVNRANSPLISKLGLTHVLGGAVDASGQKILHTTGPGVNMELHDSSMQPGQFGLQPQSQYLQPAGQFGLQPQMQYFPATCPPAIPQFYSVPPQNLASAIMDLTGMLDLVSFAEKQNLFSRDMDKVTGPKLCRCFCEPNHLADGYNFACFNADGSFKARFVLQNYSVFEVKWFKYTDSPEKGYFLFAPSVSAVYAPQNCDGTFTTDANIACVNSTMGMGWLCTAGGVENLDWEIIRRFGENARLVWTEFPDDPLLTYNHFLEAFGIVTEARSHGIEMNIVRVKAVTEASGIAVQAQESLLDSGKIKKVARRYNLPIDPVWNDLPGEIDFDDDLPVHKVLPFWTNNRVAVFFGMRTGEFLVEIIRRRPRSAMFRHPLVVVDKKDRKLMEQVHAAGGNKIRVATFDVFKDEDVFLTTVPSLAKMIFIVPPCGDSEMKVVTPAILDVCAQVKLPVGIFSRSEDAPQQEIAADTVLYNVAKSKDAEDVFFARDININSDVITRYKFSPAGVEEALVTKDDMMKELM